MRALIIPSPCADVRAHLNTPALQAILDDEDELELAGKPYFRRIVITNGESAIAFTRNLWPGWPNIRTVPPPRVHVCPLDAAAAGDITEAEYDLWARVDARTRERHGESMGGVLDLTTWAGAVPCVVCIADPRGHRRLCKIRG